MVNEESILALITSINEKASKSGIPFPEVFLQRTREEQLKGLYGTLENAQSVVSYLESLISMVKMKKVDE